MKTKEEIVRETAAFYSLKNRAVSPGAACLYNGPNGTHCAVGRCLTNKAKKKVSDYVCSVALLAHFLSDGKSNCLDDYLLEEYRGHELAFWTKLQFLHDTAGAWNAKGISKEGKEYVKKEFNIEL